MHKLKPRDFFVLACLLAVEVMLLPGCIVLRMQHNKEVAKTGVKPGDQPDKMLFEKADNEIQHGRYDVGRLTLQTLINTYPDSEYLAKAKLAIANSYYQEGGISGLTQSEAEYKDFITFFPTAPEAPEAQYRVGMAHFRMIGKPDRDVAEAQAAEIEFKEFLLKYPDSPYMPRVKARLREVQELVAEGDYIIARFYYQKGAYLAARGRFMEIADQYPNYSQADGALWYLGQTLEHLRAPKAAAPYYARLLKNYPLSPYSKEAKGRLVAMHEEVPHATKAVLARARADEAMRQRAHHDILAKLTGGMSGSPNLSQTRHGPAILGNPKATTTEASNAPGPAPGGANIAVQAVPDTALNAPAKPAEPKAADSADSTKPADSAAPEASNKPQEIQNQDKSGDKPEATSGDKPKAGANSPAPPDAPAKKKGKLHFLKKLNPF
ncbi:MAG: outer membrane protein assembly factor BamD [Terriglobia bacterium]